MLSHLQNTRQIPTSIAIVRRAPDSAESVVVETLIAFLAELMRSEDMRHGVDVEEFGDDGGAERVSGTAGGEEELVAVGVGVGPDEVGHGAFVGDFWEGG